MSRAARPGPAAPKPVVLVRQDRLGFWMYVKAKHPIPGLLCPNDDTDKIRGYRRKMVILAGAAFSFIGSLIQNAIYRARYQQEGQGWGTVHDMSELGQGHVTPHLIGTFIAVGVIYFLEHLLAWLFGIALWNSCKGCLCFLCRTTCNIVVFSIAMVIFVIAIAVGTRDNDAFLTWAWSYALYIGILLPIELLLGFYAFGADNQLQQEAQLEMKRGNVRYQVQQPQHPQQAHAPHRPQPAFRQPGLQHAVQPPVVLHVASPVQVVPLPQPPLIIHTQPMNGAPQLRQMPVQPAPYPQQQFRPSQSGPAAAQMVPAPSPMAMQQAASAARPGAPGAYQRLQ